VPQPEPPHAPIPMDHARTARCEIQELDHRRGWIILGFDGGTSGNLMLLEAGSGDARDFCSQLEAADSLIMHCVVSSGTGSRARIDWCGSQVSELRRRSAWAAHSESVAALIGETEFSFSCEPGQSEPVYHVVLPLLGSPVEAEMPEMPSTEKQELSVESLSHKAALGLLKEALSDQKFRAVRQSIRNWRLMLIEARVLHESRALLAEVEETAKATERKLAEALAAPDKLRKSAAEAAALNNQTAEARDEAKSMRIQLQDRLAQHTVECSEAQQCAHEQLVQRAAAEAEDMRKAALLEAVKARNTAVVGFESVREAQLKASSNRCEQEAQSPEQLSQSSALLAVKLFEIASHGADRVDLGRMIQFLARLDRAATEEQIRSSFEALPTPPCDFVDIESFGRWLLVLFGSDEELHAGVHEMVTQAIQNTK